MLLFEMALSELELPHVRWCLTLSSEIARRPCGIPIRAAGGRRSE